MDAMEKATFAHNAKQEITGVCGDSLPQQFPQGKNNDYGVGSGEKRWPGWPGEHIFRLLIPVQKVGCIIGRKGELIKKMCEETRARIKILEAPPGTQDRAVMISAKEELDALIPPAIDGLLRVHRFTTDGLDGDPAHGPPSPSFTVSSRLLMVAAQAGYLIGKQGSTIKSIQEASNAIVRVLGLEEVPVFALQNDRVIEIQGDPSAAQRAIELIALHLRKFLVDRSVLGLMEKHMQMAITQVGQNVSPPHQSWGLPQNFTPNAGGGHGFGMNPQYTPPPPPPRQHDDYFPYPDYPWVDERPVQGFSMFEKDSPVGVLSSTNVQLPPPMITKVTQYMQVPLSYADAVIGTSGANISYARRASGATITIQETRGVPEEMTVEVNGSAVEVQTAHQLIQNFMAQAAAALQNTIGSSADSSCESSRIGQNIGGYGSMYGLAYRY